MSDNITTPEQFEMFVMCVNKWIEDFGLKDWRMDIVHNNNDSDSLGWVKFDIGSRRATIGLTQNWGEDEVSDSMVKEVAFHEVIELLVGRLARAANDRDINDQGLVEEVHVIIRRLENYMKSIGKLE